MTGEPQCELCKRRYVSLLMEFAHHVATYCNDPFVVAKAHDVLETMPCECMLHGGPLTEVLYTTGGKVHESASCARSTRSREWPLHEITVAEAQGKGFEFCRRCGPRP